MARTKALGTKEDGAGAELPQIDRLVPIGNLVRFNSSMDYLHPFDVKNSQDFHTHTER